MIVVARASLNLVPIRHRDAVQLRAVVPVIVTATRELVGPALVVTSGTRTMGIASAEALRAFDARQLSIAVRLDGSQLVPLAAWMLGRSSAVALLELGGPVPTGPDVSTLDIGGVCATAETRGAPSALVTILRSGAGFARELIPVHVDAVEAAGIGDDDLTRLATPLDAAQASHPIEGAVLFSWFPPDPVLGRKGEVLAVALAYPYRQQAFRPRGTPAIAELIGLEDLGRALIAGAAEVVPERPELHEVTGEVEAREASVPVIEGPDEYRQKREREDKS